MAIPINSNTARPSPTLVATAPADHGLVTCPSCHAEDPLVTNVAIRDGGAWACARCGQQWDARRLASVAAYDVWAAEYDGKAQS